MTRYLGAHDRPRPAGADASSDDARIEIVLADDHRVVRRLRLLLDGEPDFEVVAEAGDVEGARRCVRGHRPAVLVLDLNMNPSLGARVAVEPPPPADDLSQRELEVRRLIALGHTNAETASRLYLSVRTIETHRSHIQQKLPGPDSTSRLPPAR